MGESCILADSMAGYIGQTVTIFTTSGGLSGSGFTGVLAGICGHTAKLITDIGAPPACPIGSACGGRCAEIAEESAFSGHRGWLFGGAGRRGGTCNWLGSVTEIPLDRIAGFTHNAL